MCMRFFLAYEDDQFSLRFFSYVCDLFDKFIKFPKTSTLVYFLKIVPHSFPAGELLTRI